MKNDLKPNCDIILEKNAIFYDLTADTLLTDDRILDALPSGVHNLLQLLESDLAQSVIVNHMSQNNVGNNDLM